MEHSHEISNLQRIEVGSLSFDVSLMLDRDLYVIEQELIQGGNTPTDNEVYDHLRYNYIENFKEREIEKIVGRAAPLASIDQEGSPTVSLLDERRPEKYQFYLGATVAYSAIIEALYRSRLNTKNLGNFDWGVGEILLPQSNNMSREVARYVGQRLMKKGRSAFAPYAADWRPMLMKHNSLFGTDGENNDAVEAGIGYMIRLIRSNLEQPIKKHNLQAEEQDVLAIDQELTELDGLRNSGDIARLFGAVGTDGV